MKPRRRRRKSPMPDPRLPMLAFVDGFKGVGWLVVLALVAWACKIESTAELVDRLDREVRAMAMEAKGD